MRSLANPTNIKSSAVKRGILITGTHRSGTTWVGKMLSLPKDIVYIHEPFNVDYPSAGIDFRFKRWFTYAEGLENLSEFRNAFGKTVTFRHRPPPRGNESALAHLAACARQSLRNARNRVTGRIPLVKDPIALLSADFLAREFDLDVVVMIRHPLAFCGSLKQWKWEFPFDDLLSQTKAVERFFPDRRDAIEAMSKEAPDIISQGILLWELFHRVIHSYQVAHPDWVFVRHEDLLSRPLEEFQCICERLEIPFSSEIRDGIGRSQKPADQEVTNPSFRARNRGEVAESWKHRLDPEETRRILAATSSLRKAFYPEDGDAPGDV